MSLLEFLALSSVSMEQNAIHVLTDYNTDAIKKTKQPNNLKGTHLNIMISGMAPTLTKALIMICASAKDHSW